MPQVINASKAQSVFTQKYPNIQNNFCSKLTHQKTTGIKVRRYLSAIVVLFPFILHGSGSFTHLPKYRKYNDGLGQILPNFGVLAMHSGYHS